MMCMLRALLFSALIGAAATGASHATDVLIRDGDTNQLNGTTYHLNGVDAPERDQICLDEHGSVWACGAEARDRLSEHIGTREVRCDVTGADTTYRERRTALCTVEGDS